MRRKKVEEAFERLYSRLVDLPCWNSQYKVTVEYARAVLDEMVEELGLRIRQKAEITIEREI